MEIHNQYNFLKIKLCLQKLKRKIVKKKKLKIWYQLGAKRIKGGDDNQSTMLLVPIKWLAQTTDK